MVAAVADWRAEPSATKIKKGGDGAPPPLRLVENPDILAGLAAAKKRPGLVVGFAAETNHVMEIGRAHVRTPVTYAPLVCRRLLESQKKSHTPCPTTPQHSATSA